jgi:hypothetical protein
LKNRFFSLLIFGEALIISAIVRVVITFFSAAVRLHWMGKPVDLQHQMSDPNADQLTTLRAVKLALTRCDRYVPWNTECYTQALTARIMLRRRQIPMLLYVGFKKQEDGPLQGHAWTSCGAYIMTGYRTDLTSFTINGCFL